MRCYSLILGIGLWLVCPRLLHAQPSLESSKVVVDAGQGALHQRLCEELESLGLVVVEAAQPGAPDEGPLNEQAKRVDALAALRVTGEPDSFVEITVLDQATGRSVYRKLTIEEAADPASAELIAVRTIELFRATLLELSAPQPKREKAKAASTAKTPVVRPLATRAAKHERRDIIQAVALGVGPVLGESRGWALGYGIEVAPVVMITKAIGVEAKLDIPLGSREKSTSAGKVWLSASAIRLGARYVYTTKAVSLSGSLGIAAEQLSFRASAAAPFYAVQESKRTFGGYLGVGLALKLYRGMSLYSSQDLAWLAPNTVVRVATQPVGDYGGPVGYTSLLFKAEFP